MADGEEDGEKPSFSGLRKSPVGRDKNVSGASSSEVHRRQRESLAKLQEALKDLTNDTFDKVKHESESRLIITQLYLKAFFRLILFSFIFALAYNFGASLINIDRDAATMVPYLDVLNVVTLITTSLGSGVGFVIGYYFKNKGD